MSSVLDRMRAGDVILRPEGRWTGDVRRMRDTHAFRYVFVFRPLVLTIVCVVLLLNQLLTPGANTTADFVAVLAAAAVSTVSMLVVRRRNPTRVAAASAMADLVLVFAYVLASGAPHLFAPVLIWPIIVIAYFASPRLARIVSLVTAIGCWAGAANLDSWEDSAAVPVAVYGVLVSGFLISLLSEQARRVEGALADALARDRVAFLLARQIRLADDPVDAISQIASTLGDATGSCRSVVLLLEHDEDHVADLADWSGEGMHEDPSFAIMLLDATMRHLVASGHGALLERDEVRLLAPEDGDTPLPPGDSAVRTSLRELVRGLGGTSGLVYPMSIAGRTVGATVLVARDADHDWKGAALPMLEPLAPQLAAGLAQTMLVRDQRETLESIDRVDRMRDRLIANVSHELRTPLTSTIGFVETALRDDIAASPEQRRDLLLHARDGGLRLLSLVEDLLALGSTRPESLDLSPEPTPATSLVDDALTGIELPEGRTIRTEADTEARAYVDRNRILQVVTNLITNALRHGAGDVVVRVHGSRSYVYIDVVDDGAGVAPEHEPELFLPFASFSSRPDSTGLGLAICRTIVEAHGGS
ncbi:MAG: GAF domain-containing sensor histidine kinase, partial [Thermoleophilia bacterium]|nr:GAF domain-containing sensor histidine kinase [Thermoleophilia bacterium]